MNNQLLDKFFDPTQGVYFVGTTPPKASTDDTQMGEIADKLLDRLAMVDYDGLIVYDIQDESARIDKPRPFPFMGTRDPRAYTQLLTNKSQRSVITYKSVSQRDQAEFTQWLNEAWNEYDVHNLVLVGSPAQHADIKLSLADAYQTLKSSGHQFTLGGVTIAERHAKKGTEHQRLLEKEANGCEFFVSQAVYDADATIKLLQDYDQLSRSTNTPPKRLILTFTPCGSAKTLEFMQWLGISVPQNTAEQIINAENPLSESVKICRENLDRILDVVIPAGIPVGLNIESLTNRKEEIEASIELFKQLKAELDRRLDAQYRDQNK